MPRARRCELVPTGIADVLHVVHARLALKKKARMSQSAPSETRPSKRNAIDYQENTNETQNSGTDILFQYALRLPMPNCGHTDRELRSVAPVPRVSQFRRAVAQ